MTQSSKTKFDVRLADADPESLGSLPVRVVASDFTLSICPQGYGDFTSENGEGCPLFVELYQGRLRVIVFPDINHEDSQIIDLRGAREDRRSAAGALIDTAPSALMSDPSEQVDGEPAATGSRAEPCECEQPGYFYSGVPGVIGRVEHGRLEFGAGVERCDQCQLYASDEIAFLKLVELGMA